MAGCCNPLGAGILCSCSCPDRSGHNAPIKLQQVLFSVCNFLSLYDWKSVNTFKGQSLENGFSCVFQAIGNILLQKVQSPHD